jgi:outer membrane protein assembly factor BamB
VLEIVNIKWWCHDVQHDEHHHDNFVDESNLYCLNISTGKLYLVGEYDDDVKNLRYFTVYGLNDFMNDEINLDGSFIIDDLTAKHLILAIKNKEERKPITIDKVLNLQHWVKPKFGEVISSLFAVVILGTKTPIVVDGLMYAVLPKDAGGPRNQFVCCDPQDCTNYLWTSGKTHRFGLGPYILADGKLFILDDNGTLTITKITSNGLNVLDEARIIEGQDAWGPIAIADGFLLMRDSKKMVCLDMRQH